jgi:hypothetical protein
MIRTPTIPPTFRSRPPRRYVATFEVDIDTPITIGATVDGVPRAVPIRGGQVFGPGFSGRVLDAGADFQQYRSRM